MNWLEVRQCRWTHLHLGAHPDTDVMHLPCIYFSGMYVQVGITIHILPQLA